jgi:hypothetical protein
LTLRDGAQVAAPIIQAIMIAVVDFRRAQDQPMQGDLLLAAAVGLGNRSRPLPFLFGRPLAVLQMMRVLGETNVTKPLVSTAHACSPQSHTPRYRLGRRFMTPPWPEQPANGRAGCPQDSPRP